MLQSFYLQSRQRSRATDGTPVTARQLESLVRLAEARARVELREEVTAQDAQVRSLQLECYSKAEHITPELYRLNFSIYRF